MPRTASDFRATFSERHWYRLSALSLLLFPFSLLYAAIVALRRGAYRIGLLRRTHLSVPVVVVGNRVAGGTGKTPVVLWLAQALQARGWRPGIVSRGYHGNNATPRAARAGDSPVLIGDEPALLAARSGVPVWIGRRRAAAAQALLASHPECDVIISDDGLQHYALARDFEIAVEDARGHGNGLFIPAGPLRESASRQVDATVFNAAPVRGSGWAMTLHAGVLYGLHDGAPIDIAALRARRLHAIAGIGHPQRFFDQLRALGLEFVAHAFPDHHAYVAADLQFDDCDAVLMTEKDAVKCRAFNREDLYALSVDAQLDEALAQLIDGRLHGLKTA